VHEEIHRNGAIAFASAFFTELYRITLIFLKGTQAGGIALLASKS
jgi:hypothetical protein